MHHRFLELPRNGALARETLCALANISRYVFHINKQRPYFASRDTATFILGSILTFTALNSLALDKPWLNSNLDSAKRVTLLMRAMTLDEKIGQMCQYIGEAPESDKPSADTQMDYNLVMADRINLIKAGKIGAMTKLATYQEANFVQKAAEQSRLQIPLIIATDALHGNAMYVGASTVFTTQIGMAASFQPTLAEQIAQATAEEMRATGVHWAYSPNVEVVRDPRWGRTGETFGEDPYLVTQMGNAMIRGYQGKNFSQPNQVLATAKHFVAGGIAFNGVNGAPADVSERTLQEIFFPPFIGAIQTGVFSIMPAHNEVNGVPCHAHHEYLTNLIRGQWGFKGIYISDWLDIKRLVSAHKIVATEKEADKVAVLAGMDMHLHGPGFFDNVKALVEEGQIPVARIDDAVSKILYAKFQLGLFENHTVTEEQVKKTLLKPSHLALALESARQSLVLLKNKDGLLPLKKDVRAVEINNYPKYLWLCS